MFQVPCLQKTDSGRLTHKLPKIHNSNIPSQKSWSSGFPHKRPCWIQCKTQNHQIVTPPPRFKSEQNRVLYQNFQFWTFHSQIITQPSHYTISHQDFGVLPQASCFLSLPLKSPSSFLKVQASKQRSRGGLSLRKVNHKIYKLKSLEKLMILP